MNRPNSAKGKQRTLRLSISKKILLGFILAVAISIAAFHWLRMIYAVLVVAIVVYLLIDRTLIRPIRALTISVIESRPTPGGFEFNAPDIHTGDELELLTDALRRMAADMNRQS